MTRADTLDLLRAHRSDFDRLGVHALAIFGSVARDEAKSTSDLDCLVEFSGPIRFSQFMDLKFLLEDLTGRRIDLVTKTAIKPKIRDHVMAELIYV